MWVNEIFFRPLHHFMSRYLFYLFLFIFLLYFFLSFYLNFIFFDKKINDNVFSHTTLKHRSPARKDARKDDRIDGEWAANVLPFFFLPHWNFIWTTVQSLYYYINILPFYTHTYMYVYEIQSVKIVTTNFAPVCWVVGLRHIYVEGIFRKMRCWQTVF